MDGLPADVAARLAEYEELAEVVRAVRDGTDAVRATACSPDGLVEATVGGRGELTDLHLDPRVYRERDSAALARTIVETVRDAAERAWRDASDLAGRLVGGEDPDPLFDPVLHVVERSGRPWRR